jgi:hypothetical protein
MPEIKFTRDTGSYTTGDTATMGAGIAVYLVKHGAAEYTNGAAKAKPPRVKRAAPKAKPTPPDGKGTPPAGNEGPPTSE